MMSSWHGANVWDWLSMALMMVGFTVLFGLTIYLMFALVSGNGGQTPRDLDALLPGETTTDERLERSVTPLAS